MTQCSIQGCPGYYESALISHTVRFAGKLVVIDHVPAERYSICGDILLSPATIERIERLLASHETPTSTAPVYDFAA